MLGDRGLNLPSESRFDDEIPAYIAEVAVDNGREVLYPGGMKPLTCYMQAPYTERISVSTTERKPDIISSSSPSCGDIQILSESAYYNLRTWLASKLSGGTGQLTRTMFPPFLLHQVAEFRRTIARVLWATKVDRHLT